MVTNQQVRRLMKLLQDEQSLATAACKAGMCEKTARKYRNAERLPSVMKKPHTWRTRDDVFAGDWPQVVDFLDNNPGLEAKTIFCHLQRENPGVYQDGQLRTLQRKIKHWRATEGPSKEIYFPQVHEPGRLAQSDFTCMDTLGVTIQGQPFNHLIYHFVLTYSNWETGSICFSESYESLSYGLQNALWKLGGVPACHQSDRFTAAVDNSKAPAEFTARYQALLNYYRMNGLKIQTGKPNENGDVEQRHHRFKRAVDQALMLRGSRDFASRNEYAAFLRDLFSQLNKGRRERLKEELKVLRELPHRRLEDFKRENVRVGPSSTIRIANNTYSVHSRLIGEKVVVHLYAEHLEVRYSNRVMHKIERLRGRNKHRIDYQHIIDHLVRKPNAFKRYRYRSDLFPGSTFRMAYDTFCKQDGRHADKQYLLLLQMSAQQGEERVKNALEQLLATGERLCIKDLEELVCNQEHIAAPTPPVVQNVDLHAYDQLFTSKEAAA